MDVVRSILDFNAGRDPERLRMKFAKMRQSPFIFLRGTAHLFHAGVQRRGVLKNAPPAWCCGDMHLENFGSYKGDNRLAYFDLNDFDEAALAPAAWDPLRLLTSLWLAAQELHLDTAHTQRLCRALLDAYADALAVGKAYWLERETASGPVRELLDQVGLRKRADFLAKRCGAPTRAGRYRRLKIDGQRSLAASDVQKQQVAEFMQGFAKTQHDPQFFEVLDVARRIAGTGSLGLQRYVILVRGKGVADGQYLLDLKQILPSVLAPAGGCRQPEFGDTAQRLVAVQRRMQAVSMAFLHAVSLDGQPHVLRGLQANEDRLDLAALSEHGHALADSLVTMGRLMAWAQLRSSGRQGAATADELIDFGRRGGGEGKWRDRLVALSRATAEQAREDWVTYCRAFDQGAFDIVNHGS
ncbi:DUF2252 domain-containing protein [Roseateles saccharophilus]|uniref:Uncharacterized protein (DUF2252 family) n=1 Tax=Roseateles saccharophilus TaxID=304 RepID=A0A4R3UJB7_ROSSA|nr:DUF2252 family protein [Roseateles saccharophilus]MDG0834428.1 DUF2252 domain-containing protein [Roseateles saccharophilus]TCU89860.1 uncharacterized protein (DUF2252 family) [Roseateles saccharophilus]